MRARNPSSGALVLAVGLVSAFLGAVAVEASDERAVGLAAAGARGWGRGFVAGFETETAGLDGCVSCLAAEEAVGAVR